MDGWNKTPCFFVPLWLILIQLKINICMQKINRRKFIAKTTMAAGATMLLSKLPKQIFGAAKANDIPIGFQSWTVKDMLGKDFAGHAENNGWHGI